MSDNYGRMTSSEAPEQLKNFCFPNSKKPKQRQLLVERQHWNDVILIRDTLTGYIIAQRVHKNGKMVWQSEIKEVQSVLDEWSEGSTAEALASKIMQEITTLTSQAVGEGGENGTL